ncbi:MAG: DNA polymerase-3 subunit beta [Alphaproteobacteria bacterium]|jgi:DNA polymerase-3 subunit beta
MKLSISRETLLKQLKHTQSIVEKRTSIAILSNVRLKATNNLLEITATNNDITVQGSTEAFIEQEGVTTVSAHKIYEIINKIPEGVMVGIELSNEGDRLAIVAGKAKFSLACLNADAFPDMTRLDDGVTFDIETTDLRRLLSKALFAVSTEETRQYLNGVYMHVAKTDKDEPSLRFVSTDGHRLARLEFKLPEGAAELAGVIIPRRTVIELRRLAETCDTLKLTINEKKLQAEAGDVTFTSKLIDGTFPDYERVIPADNKKEMDVSRQALMQAVDRVSILSHEKSRSIKFGIHKDNLLISANNPDQENALEEVKVEYDFDDLDVGFNAKYLSEIGGHIEGEDMLFYFKDNTSPVIVKDPEDASSLFVVMPMRI